MVIEVAVAGIVLILLIAAGENMPRFRALPGASLRWRIRLSYAVQDEPRGIAEALVIGAKLVGDDPRTGWDS